MKEKKLRRNWTAEQRTEILERFKASGLGRKEFCEREGVPTTTLFLWMQREGMRPASRKREPGKRVAEFRTGRKTGPYAPDERKLAVEAYLKSGIPIADFARTWGISDARSLKAWVKCYQEDGPKALDEFGSRAGSGRTRGAKRLPAPVRGQISEVKRAHPEFGLKKVRNFLMRFRGVKVSTGSIRRTVKEENLPSAARPQKRKRSSNKIRHFERARPMQLWQSDITSFVLTRHSTRVYLTVFMDDHSRYIVAWNLQMKQTSEFVQTALLDGVSRFGKPEEVLTDQGPQYFTWRGKSDFQKLLDREGVRHVVARSHHPQTLGKCERFWETVGTEFWERVKPQDLTDARIRMAHFIAHYNHSRPHQGIDGMVPADRFFGLESEVRKVIESTLSQNELRIALGDAPRSPVFLIGQIGDQSISLSGEGGSLVLRQGEGPEKHLQSPSYGHPNALAAPTQFTKGVKLHGNTQTQEEPGAPAFQNDPEDSDAGLVGRFEPGAESCGAQTGDRHSGILVGIHDEGGACENTRGTAASDLADVTAGDARYGDCSIASAQDEDQEGEGPTQAERGSGAEPRGGPKAPAQEDPRAGAHGGDPNEADRDPARVSEPKGAEAAHGPAQCARDVQEASERDSDPSQAEAIIQQSHEVPRIREHEATWKTSQDEQQQQQSDPSKPAGGSTPGSSS